MNCTSCSCATTELTTMLQCPLCPSPSQTSWGNSWPARTTTSPVWPRTTHRPWSSGGSWGTSTCPPPPTTRWCFPLVSFENISQNCQSFIWNSSLLQKAEVSLLQFRPSIADHGKTLRCQAFNPTMPLQSIQDTLVLDIYCEYSYHDGRVFRK